MDENPCLGSSSPLSAVSPENAINHRQGVLDRLFSVARKGTHFGVNLFHRVQEVGTGQTKRSREVLHHQFQQPCRDWWLAPCRQTGNGRRLALRCTCRGSPHLWFIPVESSGSCRAVGRAESWRTWQSLLNFRVGFCIFTRSLLPSQSCRGVSSDVKSAGLDFSLSWPSITDCAAACRGSS